MSIRLYMDVHIRHAITRGLRRRNIDVLTAQEDGRATLPDPELLGRAGDIDRVLFTHDDDLLVVAAEWQRQGISFAGLIYAAHDSITVGRAVNDLEIVAQASDPVDFASKVLWLPL